jgi:hypothetical protein
MAREPVPCRVSRLKPEEAAERGLCGHSHRLYKGDAGNRIWHQW